MHVDYICDDMVFPFLLFSVLTKISTSPSNLTTTNTNKHVFLQACPKYVYNSYQEE